MTATKDSVRLLSWNVNGRIDDAGRRQLARLLESEWDVVALQEVTRRSWPLWRDGLLAAGFSLTACDDLVELPYPDVDPPIRRKYFNVTAARFPLARLPGLVFDDDEERRVAFPEKYVAALAGLPDGALLELHNAHLPPGSTRGEIKIHAFEAIARRLDDGATRPQILCGDFNTPRSEDLAGIETWARSHPNVERWDRAERGILEHERLRDAYREKHDPTQPFPASHYTRGHRRRYDHLFVSPEIVVNECWYFADWLDERLSDHAPIVAELAV